jgi:hypothetical protein
LTDPPPLGHPRIIGSGWKAGEPLDAAERIRERRQRARKAFLIRAAVACLVLAGLGLAAAIYVVAR